MAAFITSVYLSDKRDKDLLSLCVAMGARDFRILMKDAIRCIVRPYSAPKVPIPRLAVTNEVDEESLKSKTVSISFGEENDADIVDILKKRCKDTQRSFFCKECLRFHLGPAFVISSAINVKTLARIKAENPEFVIPAVYGRTTRAIREGSEKAPVIQEKKTFSQMRAEMKEELPTALDDIQILKEGVTGDKIQPLSFSDTYTDEKVETPEQKETVVINETPINTTEEAQVQTTEDTSDADDEKADAAFDMLSALLGN
jgi:hypothetical protein